MAERRTVQRTTRTSNMFFIASAFLHHITRHPVIYVELIPQRMEMSCDFQM